MHARLHARVRVGAHDLAVPAQAVLAAVQPEGPPATLPRRGGALVGACPTPWGVVPVVDLSRWIDMGQAPGASTGEVLVLQEGSRRVAVRADGLHGVVRGGCVQRLHQDDDPQQLFQSAVQWPDGGGLSPLLEVGRLADLARAWADADADAACALPGDALQPAAAQEGGERLPHAVFDAGGHLWALPVGAVVQVRPAAPLEYAFPGDGATRGFCSWDGNKLPVLDLGRLHGLPPAGGALMALATDGSHGVALLVDAVRQVHRLPVAQPADGAPQWVPGLGEVRRVDAAALLRGLPQAVLAGPSTGQPARPASANAEAPSSAAHLLFEHDAIYATPAEAVLCVLALDAEQGRAAAAGEPLHLRWRERLVPVHALPCYSGRSPANAPRVALLVDPGDGAAVAIAVAGLRGWATGQRASGMRVANLGELSLLTVGEGAARSSHMVVDLAEVAYALA